MKRLEIVIAVSLLSMGLASQSDARRIREIEGAIPPVLFTTIDKFHPAYPTFVTASAAVDKKGGFDQSLFHPQVISTLEHLVSEEWLIDGCYRHTEFFDDELFLPNRSSLRLAIDNSPVVLVSKVVAREYGFRGSTPGQLLEIKVEECLKGSAPLTSYFIFVPIGTFEAGPYRFCKTDSRYPEPPSIGERVLVMLPRPIENSDEPFLDTATAEGMVVLEEDGGTRMPREFTADEFGTERMTADSVVDLARRITAEPEVQ